MEYNIRKGPIPWQKSTSIKDDLEHCSPSLSVFEIFTFQKYIRDHENVDEGHDVEHSLLRHTMTNICLPI